MGRERESEREKKEREREAEGSLASGTLRDTRATAMAESNDFVSVDMEKIYLGGKVWFFVLFFF